MRWAGLIGLAGLLAVGCHSPSIVDPATFCAADEDAVRILAGHRTVVAGTALVRVDSLAGSADRPVANAEIEIEVVGGLDGNPDYDLRVCPGDCLFANDGDFSRRAVITTDEDGIYVFTAQAGRNAAGFVLLDFGGATCVHGVENADTEGEPGTPDDDGGLGDAPERPDVMTGDDSDGGV